jgi:predicted dehydrogenase
MRTWNFGIIGAGLIADFHAKAINDLPNARLTGCCDVVPAKADKLAENHSCRTFRDFEEMVQSGDIDIVTIATPSGLHMEPAMAAASAGKHVLCEKPLDVTLERIDSMIEAHENSGTALGGIFPYRFNNAQKPLRNAIESGRFGTITSASIYVPWWRSDEYYNGSWHGTWKLDGGGALMNQSIHMVDMLCDLRPPVVSVAALTATRGHPQIETEDTAAAVLRYADGSLGMIYGTTASWPGQFRRFEITGTRGTAVMVEDSITVWDFADKKQEDEKILIQCRDKEGGGGVADPAAITHTNHARNFRAFLESLEKGERFQIDGREARKAVELILAIYRSAKEERIVKMKNGAK